MEKLEPLVTHQSFKHRYKSSAPETNQGDHHFTYYFTSAPNLLIFPFFFRW